MLRNLASFAQANPGLDFSNVTLVEATEDASSMPRTMTGAGLGLPKKRRVSLTLTATRFNYTRGWYVMAERRRHDAANF